MPGVGSNNCRKAPSSCGPVKTKPAASRTAGRTLALVKSRELASSAPRTMPGAKRGTGSKAGRDRALARALVNSRFVTGCGCQVDGPVMAMLQ